MKAALIYLNLIHLLIFNQVGLIKTEVDDPNAKESLNEVSTYNDILNYFFGAQNPKLDQDLANVTNYNLTELNDTKKIDFVCNPRNDTSNQTNQVQLITLLAKSYMPLTESNMELAYANNECILLLLYFSWCPNSVKIAPYFNAVGRNYPQLYVMAMDSYQHNTVNLRLSLFSVPSIVLLQNDRIVARFNESEINFTTLKEFIAKTTSFEPIHELEINEEDLNGPVPTKVQPMFDYIMFASIIFLLFTFAYFIRMTRIYSHLIETVRSTWLESQREHEHLD